MDEWPQTTTHQNWLKKKTENLDNLKILKQLGHLFKISLSGKEQDKATLQEHLTK